MTKAQRRARNLKEFAAFLKIYRLKYVMFSNTHYRIHVGHRTVDVWPTTAKWWETNTYTKGEGFDALREVLNFPERH